MITRPYRDYLYDSDKKLLYKPNIDHNKHLVWRPPYGGLPAINASLYDELKDVEWLGWKSSKQKFLIHKDLFDANKEVIHNGVEKQYTIRDKFFWIITDLS